MCIFWILLYEPLTTFPIPWLLYGPTMNLDLNALINLLCVLISKRILVQFAQACTIYYSLLLVWPIESPAAFFFSCPDAVPMATHTWIQSTYVSSRLGMSQREFFYSQLHLCFEHSDGVDDRRMYTELKWMREKTWCWKREDHRRDGRCTLQPVSCEIDLRAWLPPSL